MTDSAGLSTPPGTTATAILTTYHRMLRRRALIVVGLLALAAVAFCLDLITGPSQLPLTEVLHALRHPGDPAERTMAAMIVWDVRLPPALMALALGAALALAGAEMQTTLNNPLASPFTLGLSSAAVFGAALAIILDVTIPGVPPDWVIPVNAFLFALGAVALLQAMTRVRGLGPEALVLFGTALFFTFNALVSILQFVSSQDNLRQLVFWIMGSVDGATLPRVGLIVVAIALVLPFSLRSAWRLTALRLGEERARALGIDVARLRRMALLRIAILTAVAVSFTGTIPFVGLAGPHIARLLVGEDHRFFLPASVGTGAVIVSLASVLSKSVVPGASLPIGLVTALIGVPFFLSLLLGRRRTL